MAKQRTYIEPGVEVDCECRIGPRERVRGFLRLPDQSNLGRVRFIEDVRTEVLRDGDAAAKIPLDLFGGATATPACLIDCFL